MSTRTTAFWVNAAYDQGHASNGTSRYAAYVRQEAFEPYSDNDQCAELAVFAWNRATPPVMMPGYVRRHPRIRAARLERSDWDGSLVAVIDLITGQHQALRSLRGWADWPSDLFLSAESWYEPGGEDLARSRYLLCTASLRFAVDSACLPRPPESGSSAALPEACAASVAAIIPCLNSIISPVIEQIETS